MRERKKINPWKWAFIILAGIILIASFIFYQQISSIQTGEVNTELLEPDSSEMQFEIASEREDLTQLVNLYLEEETADNFVGYRFDLEEQAELHGEFELFGTDIQFSLYLDPIVLDNGNVIFEAEEISLGSLNLPISLVMSLVAEQVDFPDFVAIDSDEQTIVVNLNEFELENGVYFSVNEINLPQDNISIDIHLPERALE